MAQEVTAAFEPSRGIEPLAFGGYVRVLLRRKWFILACGAIGALVFGLAGAFLLSDTYTAETQISLSPITVTAVADPPGTARSPERDLETELTTIGGDSIQSAIDDAVDEDYSLTVTAGEGADVVLLTVTSPTLEGATGARDATVEAYANYRITTGEEAITEQLDDAQAELEDLREERTELLAPLDELNTRLLSASDPEAVGAIIARQAQVEQEIAPQRDSLDAQIATTENRSGQLESALGQVESGGTMTVISESTPTRTTPAILRQVAIGLVVGVLGAVLFLVFRQALDRSVRTKEDLERSSGLRVLGLIPRIAGWRASDPPRNASLETPASPPAEAFRTLRTSLQFLAVDRPIHRLMITSAVAGEGKTTTTANLAVTLARTGQRVIAVDADLRRPRLHSFFGMENEHGLTSVIGGESVADVLQPVEGVPSLSVLTSGPIPPDPSELLGAPGAVRVMEEVDDLADVVVIDAPPILPVTDGLIVGRMTDGVLVVALGGATTPREVHRAVELLMQVDAIVLGAVLNGVSRDLGDDYAYDYGYSYNPDEDRGGLARFRRRKPDASLLYQPPAADASAEGADVDGDEQPADLT